MKNRHSWILKAIVSTGLLYYIFTIVPVAGVLSAFRSARAYPFLIALGVNLFANLVASIRMRQLTGPQGMSVSTGKIFEINLIANFYGMFLPGSLAGGAVRWHKLYRIDGKAAGAFAAIVTNRFVLTMATIALGAVFWVVAKPYNPNGPAGIVLFSLLVSIFLFYAILIRSGGFSWEREHSENHACSQRGLRVKIGNLLFAMRQYSELPRRKRIRIAALAIAEETLGVASFYLISMSVGIDVPLVHLGWVRSFLMLITMIPISFFGLGIQEGTLIALLRDYGVPGEGAVAFSFLLVARSILLGLAGGTLEARNFLFPSKQEGLKMPEDTEPQ
jgi:uncharacterized protein (TIRG00374 family)